MDDKQRIEEVVRQIDIEKLRRLKSPYSCLDSVSDGNSFTTFLPADRLEPHTSAGLDNGIIIMGYEVDGGEGVFHLVGDWEEMNLDDEYHLPTGKCADRNRANYTMVSYRGLHKKDIGIEIPSLPLPSGQVMEAIPDEAVELMHDGIKLPVIAAKAVVAWALASRYIMQHGEFVPMEIPEGCSNLSRFPRKLLDLDKPDDDARRQILDYLRGE